MKNQRNTLQAVLLFLLMISNVCAELSFGEISKLPIPQFIYADRYSEQMQAFAEPALKSLRSSGYFTGEKDQKIYYETFKVPNPKASIVVVHGVDEYIDKFYEMIYYFTAQGYSVYALEHRGHSRSGRLGVSESQMNVENYNYYLNDFKTFLDSIVVPDSTKLYLYAHSMGGGISALFLERHPQYFQKAVLNAPMMEINFGKVPHFIGRGIIKMKLWRNKGDDYVPGEVPYTPKYGFIGSSTSCEARYRYSYLKQIATPAFQNGGASYHWLSEVLQITDELTKRKNLKKVKIPVLLFQAEYDTYVKPGGQRKFVKYAPNSQLMFVPNSKHECYREIDAVLIPYCNKVLEFYNQ